jgi:hypothetical protein
VKVGHSNLSLSHRAIDRARIGTVEGEIRPKRCTEEPHSADDGTAPIEHVDFPSTPLRNQPLRRIVYVLTVKLMITRDVHNRDRREAPARPRNAFNADVNVAGQYNDVSVRRWWLQVLEFQM